MISAIRGKKQNKTKTTGEKDEIREGGLVLEDGPENVSLSDV